MALETGGSLYWKTRIDNTGLQTGAVQAKGILRGLTRSITGMDVFAGLTIGATLVFAKIIKSAYNFSKNFESAMKEVQTISKAVRNNFEGISQEIIDMSKTVPDNALKLSKALYQIVSAGYDGGAAMDILRTSAELAVATVTDTFTAADTLTYVMNAYGIAAGTAAEISDKLFTIVKLGKVKMEELGPTISMVTGLAAEAGLGFSELAAMYTEAVKKIQPHIVSTGIRGILTAMLRVSKGTGAAADKARELGIEFDITALKSKGFKQILHEIIVATKGNEGALMELFPNVRGLIGLLAVMTDEGKGFNKTLYEIENSLGATGEAFKIMMETTESQWAIMKNNIIAKMKPLGDSILRFMNDMASNVNRAMSGVRDEFSSLERAYSELTDTLRRKQSRIDDLIITIEGLRSKTELSREETTQLEAAEKALATFYPTFEEAVEGATSKIDLLTLAKEGSYELSLKIMELELKQAEISKRRADLELAIYKRGTDEANEEIKRIQDRMDRFHNELSIKQIIEKQTTGEIKEYIKLENELSIATEKRSLEQEQLIVNVEKTTNEVDALTEALEKLREGKPIAVIPKPEEPPEKEPITIPAITDKEIEDVKERLTYMVDQYKSYWRIVAQFGEEYIEEHNIQLAEDAKNYGVFLSGMLVEYKGNAELTKEIMLDIAEYNKEIIDKRKKAEEEYFNYVAEAREGELQSEKDRYESLIKNLEEGSEKYLKAMKKNKENERKINLKYDKTIAEARLAIFKEGWEKQIGEEKEAYVRRLEGKLKELETEKVIDIERVEFIRNKLQEITEIEKELAKEKKEILESYFKLYQTTEEKIIAIHEETTRLLKLTDDKYEKDRLKIIERKLIAEVEFDKARQEIFNERAGYGEKLNNKELGNYIKFLEEMKIKYSEYVNIMILLDEKIAESQRQIWENTREEIDKTANTLHALADTVGNFNEELEGMINDIADLVGGIGGITISFAVGDIAGILTGILGIINTIFNLFVMHKSDVPELREELAKITLELQKQRSILSQAIGTAKVESIQDTIDLLEKQIDKYNEMIAAEEAAYGQFLWWTWDETDAEKIEQWLSSIAATEAEIVMLAQQYREILTGTTAESIADAIAEGFKEGLDSAEIFADTFNEMMRKAIIDAFKRTIITKYIEDWYEQFAILSAGGLTAEEITNLMGTFQEMLEAVEIDWGAIEEILEAAGIGLAELEEELEETIEEAVESIAGMTTESIADSIADGFSQGLDSAQLFADTFNDMMRNAIIDAFKKTIIIKYIEDWYDQFALLYEGGLTTEEIEALTGSYQEMLEAAETQWELMKAILEAAGISLENLREGIKETGVTGLTGAIAGITEETAGLLAGQFQAIRINTVDILSNMENIIIINSQIADNTKYNKYLENIWNNMSKGSPLESETIRSIGG